MPILHKETLEKISEKSILKSLLGNRLSSEKILAKEKARDIFVEGRRKSKS